MTVSIQSCKKTKEVNLCALANREPVPPSRNAFMSLCLFACRISGRRVHRRGEPLRRDDDDGLLGPDAPCSGLGGSEGGGRLECGVAGGVQPAQPHQDRLVERAFLLPVRAPR